METIRFISVAVFLASALALFACSSGGEINDGPSSGSNPSPSSGSGFSYVCQLPNDNCISVQTASDCSIVGGVLVDACSPNVGSCDAKDYDPVTIGSQIWMAKNLNCNLGGGKCYGDNSANCAKYGRLYNWAAANVVCPSGWHLPSMEELETLHSYLGNYVGSKLKARSGWANNGNGTDDYGFAALPGGGGYPNGSFFGADSNGYWWSASDSAANPIFLNLKYDEVSMGIGYYDKDGFFSVRCLQN